MVLVLQRQPWTGTARRLGSIWTMTKGRGKAVCELWTDSSGWALRLRSGATVQTQECGTQDDVLDTAEKWKVTMKAQGWH